MTEVNVSIPVVTGTARQGQVLSSSPGTWTFDLDYLTYAYQWERCNAVGASCVDIGGATSSSYTLQAEDVGSTFRSRVTATEHAFAPSGGTLKANFTDFYYTYGYSPSFPNGQIFHNRYNTTNLQTLGAATTSWPSTGGAAISQVTEAGNPGFRYICNAEMTAASGGKKTEMLSGIGNPNGDPIVRGLGYTDEVQFYVKFPSAGNPSGLPGPSQGVFDRRNVFWQHSMDPTYLNYFGVSRLGGTNRFFLSIMRNGGANSELAGYTLPWDLSLGTNYLFRYIVKWSNTSSGTFQWYVDGVQYANYTGVTYATPPNTEFGFYSAAALSNEVILSDIRVTHH